MENRPQPIADVKATTALILCGGLGTRLRPVTGDLPKVLAPVAGRPFLHHVFDYLRFAGITDVVLCTGYAAEQVERTCGDGSALGITVRYSREHEPLGTGGAVKNAEPLIRSNPFLTLNGDSFLPADLVQLAQFHRERRARLSLVLSAVADQARYGGVQREGDGAITGFFEKGQAGAGLINAGIYLIDRSVLDEVPAATNVSIERDVFPRWAGRGLFGLTMSGPFIDIGTPESFAGAESLFAAGWKPKPDANDPRSRPPIVGTVPERCP
jgi:NDP-sugar pyrophosphorylase family protein